jgi:hypothetical protein
MAMPQATAVPDEPEEIVREFVAAYNAHDVTRMLASCAPDVRWMSVSADKLTVETRGAEKLAEAMRQYFRSLPSSRSELRSVIVSGNFVMASERALWESAGQTRTQCSASGYEIREGKIQSVWYFPAHAC